MKVQGLRSGLRNIAWLLLTVYLSMMAATMLHHHDEARIHTPVPTDCHDCHSRTHHSGHLAATDESVADCILCQLQQVSYLAVTPLLIPVTAIHGVRLTLPHTLPPLRRNGGVIRCRAPTLC